MSGDKKKSNKDISYEEILQGFNNLRQEQRQIASKISELEMDLTEHKLVIEKLKDVEGSRKCFRMIGGVLVERTVQEVLPAVQNNKEKLEEAVESCKLQLQKKGQELTNYRQKHNIRIRGEDEIMKSNEKNDERVNTTTGILVDSKS